MDRPRAYFFGCVGGLGHLMFAPLGGAGGYLATVPRHVSPWTVADIDKREPPAPPGDQAEGPARLHHKDGWTMLSFWDRSGDQRGGSHGNFILEGTHDFDAALALASEIFPGIIARLAAPITEWVPNG